MLHLYYQPSHHGDQCFHSAALKGVRQHQRACGNIPSVERTTVKKMDSLVPYVRYYQKQKKLCQGRP
jgi:hypothetical protein